MPPRVFAFDLLLENVRELSEKTNIHAVDFKLLDFPTVSVLLKPARKTRKKSTRKVGGDADTIKSHQPKSSGKSYCKGKSVVFEMDPEELFRELKRIPLKISVRRADMPESNSAEVSNDPLKLGVTVKDGGLIDLSKMAASMEALVASEQQLPGSQTKSQYTSWRRYHSRDMIVMNESVGESIRLCVKYGLVCIGDNGDYGCGCRSGGGDRGVQKRVCQEKSRQKEEDDIVGSEEKKVVGNDEIGQQLSEKEVNLQCQPQEKRMLLSLSPPSLSDCKPQPSSHSDVASCSKDGDRVSADQSHTTERISISPSINANTRPTGRVIHGEVLPHTALSTEVTSVDGVDHSVKESQMYIPNSVCPPPLYYHSRQEDKNETIHSWQASERHCATQSDSIGHNVQQDYVDWSLIAQYDQTNCPITTHLKTQEPNPTDITPPLTIHGTTTPLKCLPLLSALVEELVHIASDRAASKEKIETTSTVSQTENLTVAETRIYPAKIRRVRKTTIAGGCGGRFVRECCVVKKPAKKLVPSNKSVLYPPDIPHKQKQYLSLKLGRKAVSFNRVAPPQAKQAEVIVKKQKVSKSVQVEKKRKRTGKVSTAGGNLDRADDTKRPHFVKKLEVFIPTQSPATTLSPSSTSDDQNSLTSSTTATVHRNMNKISVETQTEEERGGLDFVPPPESVIENSVQTLDRELVDELHNETDETSSESHNGMQIIPSKDPTFSNSASNSVSTPLLPQFTPNPSNSIALSHTVIEPEESSHAPGAALSVSSHGTSTPPPVHRKTLQARRADTQSQGDGELRLSKEKFASTSDVRSHLPESPLLRSMAMKGSLTSLHGTNLHPADSIIPENTLQQNTNREDSVMYDSFMSTEMLASATGAKSILPQHCREGVVYLATSQGSLISEPCRQGPSNEEERKGGLIEGEEAAEQDIESGDYSDDFESRTTECTCSTSSSTD